LTVVLVNQLAGFCYEMHSRQYIHEAYDICGDVCIAHMQCQITSFQKHPFIGSQDAAEKVYCSLSKVAVIIDWLQPNCSSSKVPLFLISRNQT